MEKIKIPQYLVRGKHRDFHVLCFPKLEHAWAYDEFDYQRYEIDGGYETYLWLKYAMAALIASPDKIIYFPSRKTSGRYLLPSYDAVFTRMELQFRRSEWVRLRSQLDKAHRIENYRLQYHQDKLCDALKSFIKPDQHGWHCYNDNYHTHNFYIQNYFPPYLPCLNKSWQSLLPVFLPRPHEELRILALIQAVSVFLLLP